MKALDFAKEVASYLDNTTGTSVASDLLQIEENHPSLDQEINAANNADLCTPKGRLRSPRVIGRLVLRASCHNRKPLKPSKKHWRDCPTHRDGLRVFFGQFLKFLQTKDSPHQKIDLAPVINELLGKVLFEKKWILLMSFPANILAVADVLRRYQPDERVDCLNQIVKILTDLPEMPSPQDVAAILNAISAVPAAKA